MHGGHALKSHFRPLEQSIDPFAVRPTLRLPRCRCVRLLGHLPRVAHQPSRPTLVSQRRTGQTPTRSKRPGPVHVTQPSKSSMTAHLSPLRKYVYHPSLDRPGTYRLMPYPSPHQNASPYPLSSFRPIRIIAPVNRRASPGKLFRGTMSLPGGTWDLSPLTQNSVQARKSLLVADSQNAAQRPESLKPSRAVAGKQRRFQSVRPLLPQPPPTIGLIPIPMGSSPSIYPPHSFSHSPLSGIDLWRHI